MFLVPFGSIASSEDVLPGHSHFHRFDVFSRCSIAALMCSRKLRQDTAFLAALVKPSWTSRVGQALMRSLEGQPPETASPTKVVKITGAAIPKKRGAFIPTERWLAKTFTYVLDDATSTPKVQQRCTGWTCEEVASLRDLLSRMGVPPKGHSAAPPESLANVAAFVLFEGASAHFRDELAKIESSDSTPPRIVLIVGDQTGLTQEQVEYMSTEFGIVPVTLGVTPLLTSHCIVVLHHLMDEFWPAQLAVAGGDSDAEGGREEEEE